MLAAVEVYNKPTFAYREEAFSILAANSWELLLKGRVLQLEQNKVAALLVYESRTRADGTRTAPRYRKKNRSGNYVSIGLFQAYDRLVADYSDTLAPVIRSNLEALVEIRDNAVHFFNKGAALEKAVQEIGAACLSNYVRLARSWFAVDLAKYNFFLMPLAFVRDLSEMQGVNLNAEERHLLRYLTNVAQQPEGKGSSDFAAALTVDFRVRKTRDGDAPAFRISDSADAVPITLEEEDVRDKYPWDYAILTTKLKARYSDFSANQQYHDARKKLEGDSRYCHERLFDPGNPKGMKKRFYSPNILKQFDPYYTRSPVGQANK